ncbi:MAG: hypothetical protein ACLQOZ_16055 [Acidimicrobiales bacterium]|jgi:hypothetical protein
MKTDRYGGSLLVRPVTRYQVRLVPVLLITALVVWLVAAAFLSGRWGSGIAALVVAFAAAAGWLLLRRRRLRRRHVLPPSPRAERRAARREERTEDDPTV